MYNYKDQEITRRNKLEKILKLGINPYPSKTFPINNTIKNIKKNNIENKKLIVAGRIMRINIIGKSAFLEIKDHTSRIQLYINEKNFIKKKYNINILVFKKLIDIGDIIGVKGILFKTKKGETTIKINYFKILSKSLRPIPQVKKDKKGKLHDIFNNPEKRYRMRYIDLIVNDKIKKIFIKRSKTIQSIRNFLNKKKYLEVETPILQPIPGGAIAKPFITYHNTLKTKLYLRIANELYLKRLIVGGFKGVYEFAKNFRNEGMDKIHNPEFTILELYVTYKDYKWMMDFTESLIKYTINKVLNKKEININNKTKINFDKAYPKISIYESIAKHTGFDISEMNEKEIKEVCKKIKFTPKNSDNKSKIIDSIFSEICQPNYIQPTFITDHPIEMSPLSKRHSNKKNLTERFELIINGYEIANAYSELNNPIEQLERFKEQSKNKNLKEDLVIDKEYIKALEFGMPPTAGIGIGIDRLIMLITEQKSIQEVIFFPQMKIKNEI